MLKWLLRRRIAAFERDFRYDMSYATAILDADIGAFLKLNGVMAMAAWHRDVPEAAWFAAGLTATASEDCGPCTQLMVTMAARAGVAPGTLHAIVTGDPAAMGADAALAWQFTRAVLAHAPEADSLRAAIEQLWGRRAVISLAYAITAGRMFPTLKYALGQGIACTRVQIDGETVPVARAA